MTTRREAIKRVRVTLILFAVALLMAAGVWYLTTALIDATDERVNALVCVTKPYIEQSRARSHQAELDKTATKAERARAHQAVIANDQFLAGLLLKPRNFDCKPLLDKLLKDQRDRQKRIEKEARSGNP